MVTPLMLLLSSINSRYEYDRPVDIMYLSRTDRDLIVSEVERIGKMATNDDTILTTEDCYGQTIADTAQVVNDSVVEISQPTAMLLTRIREAYSVYQKVSPSGLAANEMELDDLGADAVILRLEGNPRYIYIYIYNIMESKGMDFRSKMMRIMELYTAIVGHAGVSLDTGKIQQLVNRFELQSTVQFWQGLLMSDLLKHGFAGVSVTQSDVYKVGEELRSLGFYGFVNPLQMYMDFSGSRISRKVGVNIDQEVIDFLDKVVRSGGIA